MHNKILPGLFLVISRLQWRVACVALLILLTNSNPTPLSAQNAREEMLTVSSWGGPAIKVITYKPANWTPDSPVIFALHGVNRNLAYTLQTWTPLADRLGFLLVVPSFDNRRFPGTFSYAQGGVTNGRLPRWSSYNAILPIFAEVSRHYGVKRTGFRIYGHSAGAQFLHRFLYFHPEAPVERAVISMAGWYTLPDEDVRWPYGLGGTAIDQNTLNILTQHEIVIQVGALDVVRDEQLRRTPQAELQGRTRYSRGQNYFETMGAVARRADLKLNWRLEALGDAGHDSHLGALESAEWLAADTAN